MGETGILLSILGAVAAGTLAYVATRPATPAAAPGPSAPGGAASCTTGALPAGYTWQLATQLVHGDHVRVSMTPATFNTVASSLGIGGGGIAGWTNLLAQPQVAAVLGSGNVCAWAPGDALPTDWPSDDVDEATEYHAEFVYQPLVAIATSQLPVPVSVWRAAPAPPGTKVSPSGPGGGVSGPKPGTGQTGVGPGKTGQYNPSTAPQIVHLTTAGGVVTVGDTLPGTPLTITLDDPSGAGARFQSVTYSDYVVDASGNVTSTGAPIPMSVAGLGSVLLFTTDSASGEIDVLWQDTTGAVHTSVIKYG